MSVKRLAIVLLSICCLPQPVLSRELATLFTTQQERRLIDRNRYKQVEIEPEKPPEEEGDIFEVDNVEFTLEQVTREYRVSGITLSREGVHTVWINDQAYDDGAQLGDGSRIQVLAGDDIRVRITASDGKQYLAASGETLQINVLMPVEADQ